MNTPRLFTSIYTPARQTAGRVDHRGRTRFGDVKMFNRFDGIKNNLSGLRAGGILYLLPDMNFGPQEADLYSVFTAPGRHRARCLLLPGSAKPRWCR